MALEGTLEGLGWFGNLDVGSVNLIRLDKSYTCSSGSEHLAYGRTPRISSIPEKNGVFGNARPSSRD